MKSPYRWTPLPSTLLPPGLTSVVTPTSLGSSLLLQPQALCFVFSCSSTCLPRKVPMLCFPCVQQMMLGLRFLCSSCHFSGMSGPFLKETLSRTPSHFVTHLDLGSVLCFFSKVKPFSFLELQVPAGIIQPQPGFALNQQPEPFVFLSHYSSRAFTTQCL